MTKWKRIVELAESEKQATVLVARAEALRRRNPTQRNQTAVARARRHRAEVRRELQSALANERAAARQATG